MSLDRLITTPTSPNTRLVFSLLERKGSTTYGKYPYPLWTELAIRLYYRYKIEMCKFEGCNELIRTLITDYPGFGLMDLYTFIIVTTHAPEAIYLRKLLVDELGMPEPSS
jgi:hypothetical protein